RADGAVDEQARAWLGRRRGRIGRLLRHVVGAERQVVDARLRAALPANGITHELRARLLARGEDRHRLVLRLSDLEVIDDDAVRAPAHPDADSAVSDQDAVRELDRLAVVAVLDPDAEAVARDLEAVGSRRAAERRGRVVEEQAIVTVVGDDEPL